jgi:hypothetical protein
MKTTLFRSLCILVFISLGLDVHPSALSQNAYGISFRFEALKFSAIYPFEEHIFNAHSTARIQTDHRQTRNISLSNRWTKTMPVVKIRSITCGQFHIKWSDPDFDKNFSTEATLVVETKHGDKILEVSEKVLSPQTVQFLWCKELLDEGTPVIAYTVYSGGAHCCWNTNVVLLSQPSRWLLRVSLSWGDLLAEQLDNAGPLELVTKMNVFAGINNLPSYAKPFLPMIFAYDGKRYMEATRRFPDYISADLENAMVDLDAKSFEERVGKALRVLGDYVLLGQKEKGLVEIKAKVSDDVAVWLDKYAAEAVKCVKYRYGFDLHRQK